MTPLLIAKAGVLVAAPLLVLGTVLGPQLAVIDVREGGSDGRRLVVPVPITLARAALALAGDERTAIGVDEDLERVRPAADRFLAELSELPDAELVRVVEEDETVSIRKLGDEIQVVVRSPDEEVRVRATLDGLRRVLASVRGGVVQADDLLAALGEASRGDFVYVRSGDDVVKVKLW